MYFLPGHKVIPGEAGGSFPGEPLDTATLSSAAILFSGACLQALTGFGYSLFSLPLLVLLMPARAAVPMLSITSMFLNLLVFLRTRRDLDFLWMMPLLISGAAGIPLGIWLLSSAEPGVMKTVIGAVVTLSATAFLLGVRVRVRRAKLSMLPVGLLSGALNGATTFSGPPVILFLANQRVPRNRFRGSLAAYFLALNLLTVPAFVAGGLLDGHLALKTARMFPAVVAGALLGIWLAGKVSERLFRILALAALAGLGVLSMLSSL